MDKRNFDLEERLVNFACSVIEIAAALPNTLAGVHLSRQIIRSGTAPALQYGEAQGAESRKDFVHKMKIALKELRETYSRLKIIRQMKWSSGPPFESCISENNQLISIFVKSILTAQAHQHQGPLNPNHVKIFEYRKKKDQLQYLTANELAWLLNKC